MQYTKKKGNLHYYFIGSKDGLQTIHQVNVWSINLQLQSASQKNACILSTPYKVLPWQHIPRSGKHESADSVSQTNDDESGIQMKPWVPPY